MSLTSVLPAPIQASADPLDDRRVERAYRELTMVTSRAPPYGHRKGWVPRSQEDFGDGGAFPEVHVAQYPRGMGQSKKTSTNTLALQIDSDGRVKYEAIAKQGHGKDKVVHSRFHELVPAEIRSGFDPDLVRPDEEEMQKMTEKTKAALEKVVNSKIAAAMPTHVPEQPGGAQYIRYTPAQQGTEFNSGAKQRVIRVVESQQDPMEPPKFKVNKKIPRGPPSPPAPVMHSPPRKVTVKEQQEWKIPPCISNWKNARGFTIPLDKRLAADGRGLQDHHINDNFAKLAEALYIADRKAREAVETRAQIAKKVAQKEKEQKEHGLRQMAQKARDERQGIKTSSTGGLDDEAREREKLRHERHKDRERDRRIARAGHERRTKLEQQRDRDVSEKIALGMPSNAKNQESMYDQRLFNQSKGLDSGFAAEDDVYSVYDKPWRRGETAGQAIYRPSKNIDKDIYGDDIEELIKTNRFHADKEFGGTERGKQRDGAVQFQKDTEDDPFGLDKFMTDAKKADRSRRPHPDRSSRDYEHSSSKKARH
ncbi:SNW domain-containing protein 1-like isoform X2 [Corticium candelabrum]|uniref:SNW domain-containing protein 1-like isoform X2 n=1 Tax=Corticium candelabrum TaxID=121492 RepID=UPI002E265E15|nr:SNW domain-containing protein 1-like isoform X2 [Corticium candelabrum]